MGVSVCFGGRGEGERMKLAACVNISVNIWLCSWSQYDICVRCVCVGVCLCVLASHYHVKRADTSSALVVCMQSTKTINALTKFLHKKTATELQLQQAEYLKKYCCSRFPRRCHSGLSTRQTANEKPPVKDVFISCFLYHCRCF